MNVLITGFGPFPGVAANASATLAKMLAKAGRSHHPGHAFTATVLPVAWGSAADALDAALEEFRPDITLSFGVSHRAKGFVIETVARNACAELSDVDGRRPLSARLVEEGPPERPTRLPVERIIERLETSGLPAMLSSDAGDYLCNAIMYHALSRAPPVGEALLTGFVHIPARTGAGSAGSLTWQQATAGGLIIIDTCIAAVEAGITS